MAAVALAALLLCALCPAVLGQSTFTNTPYDPTNYHADVIVVGAGVAGLMAANALQAGGLQVLLLEAGTGAGGRVFTNTSGTLPYELGQLSRVNDLKGPAPTPGDAACEGCVLGGLA